MSYIILFGLGISSFIKKNSKVIYALLLGYAIIIFCFNTKNPDLFNYTYHYLYGGRNMEPIYTFLEQIFGMLGFNYIVFRTVLCVLGMILLSKTFWDFSPYPVVLLTLYLIYPFSLEVIQVRTFVANAIMVFSIRYVVFYLQSGSKINIMRFGLCLLIATGFHYASVFFAILVLVFLKTKKRYLIFSLFAFIFLLLLTNVSVLNEMVKIITGSDDAAGWVSHYRVISSLQILRLISTRGLLILMLWIWQKIIVGPRDLRAKNINGSLMDEFKQFKIQYYNDLKINENIFRCIIYVSLYTIVEILFGGDFERINRIAIIFSILLITRQINMIKSRNKYFMWGISIIAFILYFLSVMLSKFTSNGVYLNSVFRTVFENNLFF